MKTPVRALGEEVQTLLDSLAFVPPSPVSRQEEESPRHRRELALVELAWLDLEPCQPLAFGLKFGGFSFLVCKPGGTWGAVAGL